MSKITREDVAQALEQAASIIERRGWSKGSAYGDNNEVCANTALALANSDLVYTAAAHVLRQMVGVTWIPDWNDRADVTEQDVLDGLRKAANVARERVR
jgi:hypothetical protein